MPPCLSQTLGSVLSFLALHTWPPCLVTDSSSSLIRAVCERGTASEGPFTTFSWDLCGTQLEPYFQRWGIWGSGPAGTNSGQDSYGTPFPARSIPIFLSSLAPPTPPPKINVIIAMCACLRREWVGAHPQAGRFPKKRIPTMSGSAPVQVGCHPRTAFCLSSPSCEHVHGCVTQGSGR